jgi:LPS-assembly protein
MIRALAFFFALLLAMPAFAQDAATLVADRVFINGDQTLTAEGSVEVLYQGARVTATRITYDKTTDRLTIDGPITLNDGAGTVMLADQAQLSRDLADGILTGARMVLQEQLQLAANEIARVGGRYTRLSRVVASSCQVCPSNPTPLWEIRARRVVHDQVEHQLYFDRAQFRVMGVPILWVPRLRMPDPTLKRAAGFLVPRVRSTSELGFGLKLPYFLPLGDSRDLTFTPYVASGKTRTLELRYRQAFRAGNLTAEGAVSRDSVKPDETRGYFFADGTFALPRDFTLDFAVEVASDEAYLLDYGVTDKDRLASGVKVSRTRANEYIDVEVYNYYSLRAGDANAQLPSLVGDLTFHRRFAVRYLGGEGGLQFQVHAQRRASSLATDGDGDGQADGRDSSRATLRLDWRRNWVLDNGMVVSGLFESATDFYGISQDVTYPGTIVRTTPAAAVELRWPWLRNDAVTGVSHVIEPIVQLVWAPNSIKDAPNEDSVQVEFDEGNLFALNRFPGADRHELGTRANLGLSWTRLDPAGWSLGVTGGRVFRARNLGQFTDGSGLDGSKSDWMISARLETAQGLNVGNRAVFDDALTFARNDFRLGWNGSRVDMAAAYTWLRADAAEDRPTSTSELSVDMGWQITERWRGTVDSRYDFTAARATNAGLGLEYRNECAAIDLSLSRRFTSSTSVRATTDFNLSVVLSGFGAGADGRRYRRSCGG